MKRLFALLLISFSLSSLAQTPPELPLPEPKQDINGSADGAISSEAPHQKIALQSTKKFLIGASMGFVTNEDSAKRVEGVNRSSYFFEYQYQSWIGRIERSNYDVVSDSGNLSVKTSSDVLALIGLWQTPATISDLKNLNFLLGAGAYRRWVQVNTVLSGNSVVETFDPKAGILLQAGLRKDFVISIPKNSGTLDLPLNVAAMGTLMSEGSANKNPALSGVLEVGFRF